MSAADRLRDLSPQWLVLLVMIRVLAAATAVTLLAVHYVSPYDEELTIAVVAYMALTAPALRWLPRLMLRPAVWAVDIAFVLALVVLSGDWRSPFYLLALTTIAAPAAALRPARAFLLGSTYGVAYAVLAHFVGPDPLDSQTQTTVETLATHIVLPVVLAFGVSYAANTVRALRTQRNRAERLAIEAERQRIAWELHDSAKQRIHAAHLVLASIPAPDDDGAARAVDQVLAELRAAASDMDTSVAELASPLEGRPLNVAIRERCAELTVENGPAITVSGDLPRLEPLAAAHAYRIAAEALTNAVRHAAAQKVDVTLAKRGDQAVVVVADDGAGIPEEVRTGANGLRAMRHRAATIGGELEIDSGEGGTRVELVFPLNGTDKERQ